MMRQLLALVLAAVWLGAALLTIAVVAPGAFAVLPTRALAGDMVGRVLPTVFASAIVVHAGIPLLAPALRRQRALVALCITAAVAAALALWVVDPRIAAIRAAAVMPIDQLALADPRRTAFGLLHAVSVALLGLAMLANVAVQVLLARITVSREPAGLPARRVAR